MRRRRTKSTWFPVLGTDAADGGPLSSVFTEFTNVNFDYSADFKITPIIPDYTEDPSTATAEHTLRDFVEGQTCVIDRIVGKITCHLIQGTGSGESFYQPSIVTCCAAVAVLPVDDAGVATTTGTGEEINPLYAENLDKPWLWRRTWTLNNNVQASVPGYFYNMQGPASNTSMGSMLDGPHIDTKGVKRAIQRNQRIFLILGAQNETPGDVANEDGTVFWTVDLRVLGRMRRARNKSLFT